MLVAAPPENPFFMPITTEQLLFVLLVCLACIGVAHLVHALMKGTGILLPDFLWALLVGMVVRNLATLFRIEGINDRAAQAVGGVSLSLFLIMALMSMRILDLATLAGPMLLIIVVNALVTAAFAYFITGRVMGNDYDAAVVAGGHVAAGLATTAVGDVGDADADPAPRTGAARVPADPDRRRVLRGHRQRARAAGVLRAAGAGVLNVAVSRGCSRCAVAGRAGRLRSRARRGRRCSADVQAQLDTLFGSRVLEVKSLRRQGSAPLAGAKDGGSQAIVYYNAVLAFTAPYDPSDWSGLSPELIANALGATDEGVIGLGAGRIDAGAQLRAYGSMVYRRAGDTWQASLLPPAAPTVLPRAPAAPSGRLTSSSDSPASSTPRPDCATRTTRSSPRNSTRRCRTSSCGSITGEQGLVVATGPAGGEYARFVESLRPRGAPWSVTQANTRGSVVNALMIDSGEARFALVQSDVAAAAVTGQGAFATYGPLRHLRAVAALFPEPVHVVLARPTRSSRWATCAASRSPSAAGAPARARPPCRYCARTDWTTATT